MNNSKQSMSSAVKDGNFCEVIGGTHAGKSGNVTITVVQSNGERFKTLAKNVVVKNSHSA